MRAMLLDGYGGPEMLRMGEADEPVVGEGEVLVEVHAASVNAADAKVRQGLSAVKVTRFPHVLGRDFSGVVGGVGPGVTGLRVGDAVFGVMDQGVEGTYAEKLVISAALVAEKPDELSHAAAAAVGLIGLTALTALEDSVELRGGETILIQGGAGGVAGFAIGLAKYLGATVITTASAPNHEYVRRLGADRIIDYREEDFTVIGPICDVVFDTVGGDVHSRCYEVLKPRGRLVHIASVPQGFQAPGADIRSIRPNVKRDRVHLERVLSLVERCPLLIPEIVRYPLSEAACAHAISEGRHLRGKLVLDVR